MRSALLDRIVRQQDPELLKAVEHLSKNETATGVRMLQQQGRVTEIPDAEQRIATIAKTVCRASREHDHRLAGQRFAARDQSSSAARIAGCRSPGEGGSSIRVLTPRSDMTGADRAWAARYRARRRSPLHSWQ